LLTQCSNLSQEEQAGSSTSAEAVSVSIGQGGVTEVEGVSAIDYEQIVLPIAAEGGRALLTLAHCIGPLEVSVVKATTQLNQVRPLPKEASIHS